MGFRINILADYDWETRVGDVLDILSDTRYRFFFSERTYGSSVEAIVVVLMCQPLDLKRRVRFSKKNKTLYMDIMLDYEQFIVISQSERNKIVIKKLISEVPEVLAKYKFEDFNYSKFQKDFVSFFGKVLKNIM